MGCRLTSAPALEILLKRAYEPAVAEDGCRVLVDRLWPRGRSRIDLAIDHWAKDVAPGPALRRWYGHDPGKWGAFRSRYEQELDANQEAVRDLLERCRRGRVTLVFGARDVEHSHAIVLRDHLLRLA
ncbi:MAG: DUF488 family protein [Geminicoccaceae bacterium]